MTLRQWLVLWLWLSSRAPQRGRGPTSNDEALREAETIEVIEMPEDHSGEAALAVEESVSATNLKVLGDGPAFYSNLAMKQALSESAGWTSLNQAIVGKAAESIMATSPSEGGSDLANLITSLMAATKGGGNIPPVTP